MWNPFKSSAPKVESPPIQNIGSVDLVGKGKDGGVDLLIVVSSRLTGSPEHQRLLLDKIESYLRQLNTPAFKSQFKNPPADKVKVVVACTQPPDPIISKLIEKSKPWVAENNARLELQIVR